MRVKVSQLLTRGGNPAPYQYEIHICDTEKSIDYYLFQSYSATIAKMDGQKIYLDKKYWNYSQTTRNYRNQFLNMSSAQIKNGIDTGKIKLVNLN